ncbi:MAG: hypothetical protein KGY76_08045, partial [Candidatus Thermoplasmatota archaeon]|nr:hypothetical protein [Candidatus Thermoplasmatota archaeon]
MINKNESLQKLVSLSIGIFLLIGMFSPLSGALGKADRGTDLSEDMEMDGIQQGDTWHIEGTEYLNGTEKDEFSLDKNILIDGGKLEINNATLTLLIDGFQTWNITLTNGGELQLWNSVIRTQPDDTQLRPFLKTKVVAESESSIELMGGSSFKFPGWVYLYNSNLRMEDSSFESLDNIPDFDYTWGYGDQITGYRDNDDCPMLIAKQNSEVVMIDSEINDYYTNTALSRMDWYASERGAQDNTADNEFSDLREEDGQYYSVNTSEVMHFDEWALAEEQMDFPAQDYPYLNPIDKITALYLEVSYRTGQDYGAASDLSYRVPGGTWETAETIDGEAERIEQSIWKLDLEEFSRDEAADEFIYDLELRFENGDTGANSTVDFDRVRLTSAHENDMRIENSDMTVINSYIDVDFRPADVDPRADTEATAPDTYLQDSNPEHRAIRVYDSNFKAYGLEVTGEPPADGDPCIVEAGSSTSEIYRWAKVVALDETEKPIEGADIESDYNINPTDHEEALEYRDAHYPGEYISSEDRYVTGEKGIARMILKSDQLNYPSYWPNGQYTGSYKLDGSYEAENGDVFTTSEYIGLSSFPNLTTRANNQEFHLRFGMEYPLPDLNVYEGDLTVDGDTGPVQLVVNKTSRINLTVKNEGESKAEDVELEFDLGGEPVKNASIDEVPEAGEGYFEFDWAPEKDDTGMKTLTVTVDPYNKIEERDRENHEESLTVEIQQRPDLVVDDILFEGEFARGTEVKEGEEVEVYAEVANRGQSAVDGAEVKITYDGGEIGSDTVNLEAGQGKQTSRILWEVPAVGEYTVESEIDPEDQVDESETTNNLLTKDVEVVSSPDVGIETFDVTAESDPVWVGDTVTIGTSVNNQGGWPSGQIEVSFYVDHNKATEELIESVTIQGIEGGETSNTLTVEWTAEIHESLDQDSQDREISVTVKEVGKESPSETRTSPPLTVEKVFDLGIAREDVTFEPMVVTEGYNVSITSIVRNLGEVYAENFTLSFYVDGEKIDDDYNYLSPGSNTTMEFEWEAEMTEDLAEEDRTLKLEISETTPEQEDVFTDNDVVEVSVLVKSRPELGFVSGSQKWLVEGEETENETLELEEKDLLTFNGTVKNSGETAIRDAMVQFTFPDGTRNNVSIDVAPGESVYVEVDWEAEINEEESQDLMIRIKSSGLDTATIHQEVTREINIQPLSIRITDRDMPENPKPGETYFFGGVLQRESDGKLLGNTDVRIAFVDSGGDEVKSIERTTNDQGEFGAQITMPDEAGEYTVVFEPQTADRQTVEESINVGEESQQGLLGIPWWILIVIVIAAAGSVGSLFAYLKFFGPGEVVECGNCGASIPADSTTCPKCGVEFDMETVKCSECGEWIPATSDNCPECGAEFIKTGEEVEDYTERMRKQYEKFVSQHKQRAEENLGRELSKKEFPP